MNYAGSVRTETSLSGPSVIARNSNSNGEFSHANILCEPCA